MGLFDKVKDSAKDATGIGLNAEEQYARAYSKGVLLQPPDYGSAAKQFASAAEKFTKDGNFNMAKHARANSSLYGVLHHCDVESVTQAIQALEQMPEIEALGSQKEMIPTPGLVTELKALQLDCAAEGTGSAANKAEYYAKASEYMLQIARAPLGVMDRLRLPGPVDTGMMRGYYYMALTDYYEALSVVAKSPSEAEIHMQKAESVFRQAKAELWVDKASKYLEHLKSKRHCWICNREMQGKDIFYSYYPASVEEYHKHMIESLNQDTKMLDVPDSVTLCTVCGSAVERQADRYATLRVAELRQWVTPILENHNQRIEWCEKQAHTHSH